MHANPVLLVAGLLLALGAAALLVLEIVESGPAAMLGIIGIGLMGASAASRRPGV